MHSSWRLRAEIPARSIAGVAIYQTGKRQPITAATMRQRLAERIGHCPPLRWKLVTVPFGLDRPVFVDSEVNL